MNKIKISPEALEQVLEFHLGFEHPVLVSPTIPNSARCDLRYNLIKEELGEFREAAGRGDIVEVADALADIQYVVAGTVLEFGLGDKFKDIFEEVHRSNMSKACNTKEEAEETCQKYEAETNHPCEYEIRNGKYFVYRISDRKTIKSINYSPADVKGVIDETGPKKLNETEAIAGFLAYISGELQLEKGGSMETDLLVMFTDYVNRQELPPARPGWQKALKVI